MVRSTLSVGLAAVFLSSGVGWPESPAAGQTVLKRLEQEIRRQVAKDEAAAASAAEDRPEQKPGYLGAVVDDRQDRGRGVRVLQVRPQGPAALAGLREGDLVTGVAGVRVRQTEDLADVMAVFPPGSRVAFDVLRDGQTAKFDVILGRREESADTPLPLPETVPLPLPEPLADPVEPPATPAQPGMSAREPAASADPSPDDALPPGPDQTEPGVKALPPDRAATADELARLRIRIAELERRVEQLERALADLPKRQ
jgi:hypothetical protein